MRVLKKINRKLLLAVSLCIFYIISVHFTQVHFSLLSKCVNITSPFLDTWIVKTAAKVITEDSKLYNHSLYNTMFPQCLCEAKFTILIAVMTGIPNRLQRNSIRQSWNLHKDTYWYLCNTTDTCNKMREQVKIVFFIGQTTNMTLQKDIQHEGMLHHDVIQGNFLDHYQNLTLKSLLILHWWKTYCTSARFLLKIDDNVHLKLPLMMQTVAALEHIQYKNGFIAGYAVESSPVIRKVGSEFFVPPSLYSKKWYPQYIAGPAYIISKGALEPLWQASLTIPKIPIEDIYINGVCRTAANIAIVNRTEFCSRVRVSYHLENCATEHRRYGIDIKEQNIFS